MIPSISHCWLFLRKLKNTSGPFRSPIYKSYISSVLYFIDRVLHARVLCGVVRSKPASSAALCLLICTMISFSFLVLLAHAALAAGQSCKPHDVPFNSSLVGKTFTRDDNCYRPSAYASLKVQDSVLVYYPEWNWRAVGTPYAPYCRELYVYHFRKNDMLPFIEHYKPLNVLDIFKTYPSTYSTEEANRICNAKQKPVKYSVWGNSTRPKFISSIRRFVKELPKIRDQFLCAPLMETPQRFVENPETKSVDVFINLFIGVGYTHFFCAQ